MLYRLHSAGDLIGHSPSGIRRLAKLNNPQGAAFCTANEYIRGELPRFLRLPAPPVAFVSFDEAAVKDTGRSSPQPVLQSTLIHAAMGFRRFLPGGLSKAQQEWALRSTNCSLRRLFPMGGPLKAE